ncbi:uncharacterized protein LOC102810092 [Saccoglossus kowalevskii]
MNEINKDCQGRFHFVQNYYTPDCRKNNSMERLGEVFTHSEEMNANLSTANNRIPVNTATRVWTNACPKRAMDNNTNTLQEPLRNHVQPSSSLSYQYGYDGYWKNNCGFLANLQHNEDIISCERPPFAEMTQTANQEDVYNDTRTVKSEPDCSHMIETMYQLHRYTITKSVTEGMEPKHRSYSTFTPACSPINQVTTIGLHQPVQLRKRKQRTVFSAYQLNVLERHFHNVSKYPDVHDRSEISKATSLANDKIKQVLLLSRFGFRIDAADSKRMRDHVILTCATDLRITAKLTVNLVPVT